MRDAGDRILRSAQRGEQDSCNGDRSKPGSESRWWRRCGMMQWKQLKGPERLGAGERGGDAARADSGATSECHDAGWANLGCRATQIHHSSAGADVFHLLRPGLPMVLRLPHIAYISQTLGILGRAVIIPLQVVVYSQKISSYPTTWEQLRRLQNCLQTSSLLNQKARSTMSSAISVGSPRPRDKRWIASFWSASLMFMKPWSMC